MLSEAKHLKQVKKKILLPTFDGFERKHEKLAPVSVFAKRMAASVAISGVLIFIALLIGVTGYHWIAGFSWVDSLLEASMILSGMGPVNQLTTSGSKIFASVYALFSGVLFIGVMGIILAPIVHRIMHKFHFDERDIKS